MRYYPIFVNLARKKCLVVGAGQVGKRKIATLASCGADEVLVLDIDPQNAECAEIRDNPTVRFECRKFRHEDLDGRFIVIASTSNEDLNWEISRECERRGILCNIVDQPEKCSFIVPALYTQGDLTMAVSTGGGSPALARKIRKGLHAFFGSEYGAFLTLMGKLRPMVLALDMDTEVNSDLFRSIVDSPLMDALGRKDADEAETILRGLVPESLCSAIPELVRGVLTDGAG